MTTRTAPQALLSNVMYQFSGNLNWAHEALVTGKTYANDDDSHTPADFEAALALLGIERARRYNLSRLGDRRAALARKI